MIMLLGLPGAMARRPAKPPAEGTGAAAARSASGAAGKARQLLLEGSTSLINGDLAAASVALTEAYRLGQLPAALYQLGALAAQQGRGLAAQDFMRRYLADPAIDTTSDSAEQAEARRIVAQPSPAHGSLAILGESGTQVLVDGNLVGVIPLSQPLLIAPGEHQLGLETGSQRIKESVLVVPGRLSELRFDFAAKTVVLKTLPTVLIVDHFTGLNTDQTTRFTRSMQEAIQAEHLAPLRRAQALEALHDPQLAGCPPLTASCQVLVGKKSATASVLTVKVERTASGWQLGLQILDVNIGEPAAQLEKDCPGCSAEQAATDLASAFAPLWRQASGRLRGTLTIHADVAGAEVSLDDRKLGPAPLTQESFTGPHVLRVTQGGRVAERKIEVQADATQLIEVEVSKAPLEAPAVLPPPPPPPVLTAPGPPARLPRPRWRLATGTIAIVAGSLLLGFGAGGLAVNGQCIEPPPSPTAECDRYYRTTGLGAGLTGAGGALLVGGVILLAVPGPRGSP